jgi:hypothetical protein
MIPVIARGDPMQYESPEIIATYVEDELVAEAAVSTCYGNKFPR